MGKFLEVFLTILPCQGDTNIGFGGFGLPLFVWHFPISKQEQESDFDIRGSMRNLYFHCHSFATFAAGGSSDWHILERIPFRR